MAALLVLSQCRPADKPDRPLIGFSMDTLEEERWQRDRDLFVAAAERLGAEVLVQSAGSDDARQIAQCENLITQGVDVLVVVPHNGKAAAAIVESAHRAGIPVIAYDRMINDADLDLYVSFDNARIGELQADYLVRHVPQGNYVLIGGDPADFNSHLYREGQMRILQPFVDRGAIRIVAAQWAQEWQPIEALRHVENALTQHDNRIDAVVASNDGTAGGAIQALAEQGLAGTVKVSGQDAELAALQRVVAGTQAMTIYKPLPVLAATVAEAALHLIRGETPPNLNAAIHNGKIDVPSIQIDVVVVDSTNVVETVIKDGFHSLEAVYQQ
jgi:D-xylose transport system substrate-binding protein